MQYTYLYKRCRHCVWFQCHLYDYRSVLPFKSEFFMLRRVFTNKSIKNICLRDTPRISRTNSCLFISCLQNTAQVLTSPKQYRSGYTTFLMPQNICAKNALFWIFSKFSDYCFWFLDIYMKVGNSGWYEFMCPIKLISWVIRSAKLFWKDKASFCRKVLGVQCLAGPSNA